MIDPKMVKSAMPTVAEILQGHSQGGVPRPTFSIAPGHCTLLASRTFSADDIAGVFAEKLSRWAAIKALFRVIIWGN